MLLIAIASMVAAAPTPASVQAGAFVRIERAALINAEAWKQAGPEVKRRERIIKDERGEPQLQRVVEFE